MVFSGMIGTNVAINHVAARMVTQCGCGDTNCNGDCARGRLGQKKACQSCNTDCRCVQCPRCEGDICRLELDRSAVNKTCFKVEQKTICVPPVRLPWKKCPPGTSKTKRVKVLSLHTYECPNCAYKWKLQELETPQNPNPAEPEKSSAVPVPPIYEVYYPKLNQPSSPAEIVGSRPPIVVTAKREAITSGRPSKTTANLRQKNRLPVFATESLFALTDSGFKKPILISFRRERPTAQTAMRSR